MSVKVLALIDKDATLLELCKSLENRSTAASEQLKFLRKQAEAVKEKLQQSSEPDWDAIIARLKETGALSADFNPNDKDKHLEYDLEENAITLCDHSNGDGHHHHPLEAFFSFLKGPRE